MSFDITLGYSKSPKIQLTKEIVEIATYTGTLKEETSLIDPVVLVYVDLLSEVRKSNYMIIPQFGRKYFITNITVVRDNLVAFECHVDVLSTYEDSIRNQTGIVKRSEQTNMQNLYLNDGFFKVYQNPHVIEYEFPLGFTEYEFVLAMAGS